MSNIPGRRYLLPLVVVLLGPAQAEAQQAPPQGPPPGWWLSSAHALQPRPEGLLVHGEAQYGYNRFRGNFSGSQHDGSGLLAFRKGLFTSTTNLLYSRHSTEIGGGRGTLKQETLYFEQAFRYDLNRLVGLQVGLLGARDEARYIDLRSIWYGGVNLHPITSPRLQTKVLLAGGHQREEYTVAEEPRSAFHGYVGTQAQWAVTDRLSLSESGSVLFDVEDAEDYLWNVTVGAQVAVTRHVALVLQHSESFDNEPVPSVAARRDSHQSVMVKLTY